MHTVATGESPSVVSMIQNATAEVSRVLDALDEGQLAGLMPDKRELSFVFEYV